mmetsp:Transcript_7220/g.18554  ORF Transcript_7220/g.18554 Transcript_7220/m.18554 type:complete len:371 (-) Transcript_7220:389-1501(-)
MALTRATTRAVRSPLGALAAAGSRGRCPPPARFAAPRRCRRQRAAAAAEGAEEALAAAAEVEEEEAKSDAYSDAMQKRMGGSLQYRHEDGINWAYVLPDVIVGSCPQSAADVDRLVEEENVGVIFCLQEDKDAEYFGFAISDIKARCEERGDVTHVRCPVADFDPFSLRLNLPDGVAALAAAHAAAGPGRPAYIHCTAGLGRAPGTALAYMYWTRGLRLMEAHAMLMEVRPCHPKLEAIKEATCDLLFQGSRQPVALCVYRWGTTSRIQVSGLDVGWGEMLDLEFDAARRCFVLERELLPGKYPYKFICDGVWGYSADHPTFFDGEHTNNYIMVPSNADEQQRRDRERLMSADPHLSSDEAAAIRSSLGL